MNKKYEYGGLIYCEDDLSESIDNYGGNLYDLFLLLEADDIEETIRAKVYFQLLKNLTDKETPKKPVVIQDDVFGDYHLVCPNCGQGAIVIAARTDGKLYPRCPFCGQKLMEEDEDDC